MAKIITIPQGSIIYDIDIEIHKPVERPTVYTKQYDSNTRFIVATVYNDGEQYILTTSDTIHFACTKPDGFGIDNECGIDNEGRIVYKITDQTSAKDGQFPAEFRIYSTYDDTQGNTVQQLKTTANLKMWVDKSTLNNNTIISSDEANVLTALITDATAAINDATTATTNAINATNTINQLNTDIINSENIRNSNENTRISSESTRESAENTRISNENTRKTNEESRANAESSRVANENTRTSNESTRETQESTRQSNEAIRQNQEVTRQEYYNAYKVCEAYDNLKAYVVGNKVTYQGSTYQNILASTGILPTNTTNWILIAAKGIDGVGGDMKTSIYDPTGRNTDIFAHDTKDDTVTFAEATTESDITTGEKHSTLFGKILKSLKTIKTKIGDLTQLQTTSNTDLVGAVNEIDSNNKGNSASISSMNTTIVNKVDKTYVDSQMLTLFNNMVSPNLFNKSTIVSGSYLDNSGAINSMDTFAYSDYIAVTQNTQYEIHLLDNADNRPGFLGCYYDSSHTFIDAVTSASSTFLWTAPTNAAYVRLNMGTLKTDDVYIKRTTITRWSGKTANFLGDSITYGYSLANIESERFSALVKNTLSLATSNNYGLIGTKITKLQDGDGSFTQRFSSMADADIVFVLGGTNDYGHNTGNTSSYAPFGSFSDRTDGTFYGALHVLYRGLIEKYPSKDIIVITPPHRFAPESTNDDFVVNPNTNKSLKDYVGAIKEVAQYYGLPVLDLYANLNINPIISINQSTYMPDGLHPNANGHRKIADKIYQFMMNLT